MTSRFDLSRRSGTERLCHRVDFVTPFQDLRSNEVELVLEFLPRAFGLKTDPIDARGDELGEPSPADLGGGPTACRCATSSGWQGCPHALSRNLAMRSAACSTVAEK